MKRLSVAGVTGIFLVSTQDRFIKTEIRHLHEERCGIKFERVRKG
jgi:hypothetical protein